MSIPRTKIITKPDEVRAKIVPSDYNKAGVKRITIYIGKNIYNDFFPKQEHKGDTRVKLDLKEDGKLILRKTRYPEGAKLCLQIHNKEEQVKETIFNEPIKSVETIKPKRRKIRPRIFKRKNI
jgi:hypothetical protein